MLGVAIGLGLLCAPVLVPAYAYVAYCFTVKIPKGFSQTAVKAYFYRVYWAVTGERKDRPVLKLAEAMDFFPFETLKLFIKVINWIEEMSGERLFPSIRNPSKRFFAGEILIKRTLLIDALVKDDSSYDNLVIIGAGLDVNSYQKHTKGKNCYEIDQKGTQSRKKVYMERTGLSMNHVTFVACRLGEENWIEKLKEVDFDFSLRTLVIMEGLAYYVSEDDFAQTLGEIAANMAPGSQLFFDFPFIERAPAVALKNLKRIGEPWLFNVKAEPTEQGCTDAITKYLEPCANLRITKLEWFTQQGAGFPPFYGGCCIAQCA